MSRTDVKEGIVAAINGNIPLLALLGTVSNANFRVYSGWPQQQPVLTEIEPASEGWIVLHEENTAIDFESIYEEFMIHFDLYVTRNSLADDIIDQLDKTYNWRIPQQRNIVYGEHILLLSKREKTTGHYEEKLKLYRKDALYHMSFVRTTAEP